MGRSLTTNADAANEVRIKCVCTERGGAHEVGRSLTTNADAANEVRI